MADGYAFLDRLRQLADVGEPHCVRLAALVFGPAGTRDALPEPRTTLPLAPPPFVRGRERVRRGALRPLVSDYVSRHGPCRAVDIADALGLNPTSVANVLYSGNFERDPGNRFLWRVRRAGPPSISGGYDARTQSQAG